MRLSVLDQSIVAAGRTACDAIRETVALAEAADRLGYHRFWVSEHHGYEGLAGSAPEVLLGAIAMVTRRIRIGSAALILPHVSPLKAAEQMSVLGALAPGRVDVGIGRGPGADRVTRYALNPAALDNPLAALGVDSFPDAAADLIHLLRGEAFADDHPFCGVRAVPAPDPGHRPEAFMVGGTPTTARLAGLLGLPYAYAHFVADGAGGEETVAAYRAAFRPGPFADTPTLSVCAFAMATETAEAAGRLHSAYSRWRAARDRGRFVPLSPVSDLDAPVARCDDPLFGTADTVLAALRRLAARYGADELVVQAPVHDLQMRIGSLQLLSEAAKLDCAVRVPFTGAGRSPSNQGLMEPPS